MAEKVCPFEDIKEGHSFSGALASFWKIKVVWGRFGPNNAMRQDNGIKVCFADVQPVTPIVCGDPDFSTIEPNGEELRSGE